MTQASIASCLPCSYHYGFPLLRLEHGYTEPVGRELSRRAGQSGDPVHVPLVIFAFLVNAALCNI